VKNHRQKKTGHEDRRLDGMNQNAEADYDESTPRNGFLAKINRMFGKDEYEEEEEEVVETTPPSAQTPPVNRASGGSLNPQTDSYHRPACRPQF
jgi:hypothetical protein